MAEPKTPKTDKVETVRKDYVRSATGSDFYHLFTGEVFNAHPKKVEIDNFIEVQAEAGKLILGED